MCIISLHFLDSNCCFYPCRKRPNWMTNKAWLCMTSAACGYGWRKKCPRSLAARLLISTMSFSTKGSLVSNKTRHTYLYGVGWRQPTIFWWLWLDPHNSRHISEFQDGCSHRAKTLELLFSMASSKSWLVSQKTRHNFCDIRGVNHIWKYGEKSR